MEGKERRMYRMYGQKIAPAFSALPPSVAVVCRGAREGKERCVYSVVRYAIKARDGNKI
jgi:hypothetical protein